MAELKQFDLSETKPLKQGEINAQMDPRLQFHVARSRSGYVKAASCSTTRNEIAVIARVTSDESWAGLSEVREPVVIGDVNQDEFIVTGRVPISRVEKVREQEFIKSLKAAQTIYPTLNDTIVETQARPDLLPAGHKADGGKGTVVGIIDYGGDFAHENFLDSSHSTRITHLWYQDGISTHNSPFGYGREFTRQELNLALQQVNPYQAIGYDPADFEDPADPGSHGTHVMDIAAGNGRGSAVPGMAPNAELIFVNISHRKDPRGTNVVGQSFGDSVRLLEALKYIFDRAGSLPCVVNISLGTNGGPHDGSTLVEQGIDSLITAQPNRAVTIAAANSFDDGIHAAGCVKTGQTFDLNWNLMDLRSDIEMEIWYPADDLFTVELLDKDGTSLGVVAPGNNLPLSFNGQVVVFIANRLKDPNNNDNMIGIFLASGFPAGTYTVRLHGDQVTDGNFHAWIERDNRFQSQFAPPHDNTYTIGSISCSHKSIAVGSYDAHKNSHLISYFSSAGPTRDQRNKPEVSAPGHAVRAAQSCTRTGTRIMSGTSMAAPAVAGLISLMFAEAKARNMNLTVDEVRDTLIRTARKNPPAGTTWDDRYGYGRISASQAINAIMELDASPTTTSNASSGPQKKSPQKEISSKKSVKKKSSSKKAGKK